jgi:hypothetical protein
MRSPKRTIIIGDVHGCSAELADLLKAVNAGPDDDLISVGDLICKGPDSLGVMRWAAAAENLRCVMGNHELRLLNQWRKVPGTPVKSYDAETIRQLGSEYGSCMEFISTWRYYWAEQDFLVVHAGIDSRKSLAEQDKSDLVHLREIEGAPWFESYREKRLIVFGHWAARGLVDRPNAIGLDSGCVYGGKLSALILPERRVVSVPAHKTYVESSKKK